MKFFALFLSLFMSVSFAAEIKEKHSVEIVLNAQEAEGLATAFGVKTSERDGFAFLFEELDIVVDVTGGKFSGQLRADLTKVGYYKNGNVLELYLPSALARHLFDYLKITAVAGSFRDPEGLWVNFQEKAFAVPGLSLNCRLLDTPHYGPSCTFKIKR